MPRIKITSLPKAKLGKSQVGGQCPMGSSWDAMQQRCVPTIQGAQSSTPAGTWENQPSTLGGPPQQTPVYPAPLQQQQSQTQNKSTPMNFNDALTKTMGKIGKAGNTFELAADLTSMTTGLVNNWKGNKAYNKWLREGKLAENTVVAKTPTSAPEFHGNTDINNNLLGDYGFKSIGVQANPYYARQNFAAEGMTVLPGDRTVQPSFLPDIKIPEGVRQQTQQTQQAPSQPSDKNIADIIAAKESGGDYQALPRKKDGTLASSAVGKYQFLWNQNKDWIEKVTGVNSKTGFMNNPEAQEKAFKYWDQTVLTPNAMKIKEELGVQAPIDNIKYAIHFAGPKGAYRYFATGEETTDAFGSNVASYAKVSPRQIRQNIDQSQVQNLAALNQGIKETGGQNNNTMKIRIVGTPDKPQMAGGGQSPYSGQSNYGLYIGQRNLYSTMANHPYEDVKKSVTEEKNPKAPYVLEAEGGETILRPDGTHMNITGKRHTQGGEKLTAEQAPEGSFIYSDTKKMTIKNLDILKEFGMAPRKQGYTPAEIAKKYDTNKYRAILSDPNTDDLQKNTAKRMLDVYEKKLAELAMVQEGMKGFPNGIPDVAKSLFPSEEQTEEQAPPQQGPEEEMAEGPQGQEAPPQEMMEGQPPMQMYGGSQDLDKYQVAGPVPAMAQAMSSSSSEQPVDPSFGMQKQYDIANRQVALQNQYPWFKPWTSSKTVAGRTSPKNKQTTYRSDAGSVYDNLDRWVNQAEKEGININDTKSLQRFIYNKNPKAAAEMWKLYGHTASSPNEDVEGFSEGIAGDRLRYMLSQPNGGGDATSGRKPPLIRTVPGRVKSTVIVPPQERDEVLPNNTGGKLRPGDFRGRGENIPKKWAQQDINNLGAAALNLGLMRKYHMQSGMLEPVLPQFVPTDWRGYAGTLQSNMGRAADQLNTYQPGTATAANLSFLQGQTGEDLHKYISGTNEYNAKGLSDMDITRANIMNMANQYNLGKRDYDKDYENTADSKYRAAVAHGTDRVTAALNQGLTNSANIYNMNVSQDPDYYIDPRSGTMKFNDKEAYARYMARMRGGYQDPGANFEAMFQLSERARRAGYDPATAAGMAGFGKVDRRYATPKTTPAAGYPYGTPPNMPANPYMTSPYNNAAGIDYNTYPAYPGQY